MTDFVSPELTLFLIGTFVASLVTGLAGFAFGMVAAAIWLHGLGPAQTATLIVAYALLVQGHATWTLRHAIKPRRLAPIVLGSAIGIPVGAALMTHAAPGTLRLTIGVLLILFSSYNLARPKLTTIKRPGALADGAMGVANGIVAGSTGLGGILPAIWCSMRGWPRDEQRAVFQPTAVASFLMTLLWFGGAGVVSLDTLRLFIIGLPALVVGTLLGWKLYGKLDDVLFRKIVLILLLVSGLALVVTGR